MLVIACSMNIPPRLKYMSVWASFSSPPFLFIFPEGQERLVAELPAPLRMLPQVRRMREAYLQDIVDSMEAHKRRLEYAIAYTNEQQELVRQQIEAERKADVDKATTAARTALSVQTQDLNAGQPPSSSPWSPISRHRKQLQANAATSAPSRTAVPAPPTVPAPIASFDEGRPLQRMGAIDEGANAPPPRAARHVPVPIVPSTTTASSSGTAYQIPVRHVKRNDSSTRSDSFAAARDVRVPTKRNYYGPW